MFDETHVTNTFSWPICCFLCLTVVPLFKGYNKYHSFNLMKHRTRTLLLVSQECHHWANPPKAYVYLLTLKSFILKENICFLIFASINSCLFKSFIPITWLQKKTFNSLCLVDIKYLYLFFNFAHHYCT